MKAGCFVQKIDSKTVKTEKIVQSIENETFDCYSEYSKRILLELGGHMASGKKQATIVELARLANTSTATVSRVLSGSSYPVSETLRDAVLKAAAELNYVPNAFGQSLKNGRSHDIGVIIPGFSNPFYMQMISGVEKACRDRGFNPIFCSSNGSGAQEIDSIELLRRKCVEGMILSTVAGAKGIQTALQLHKNVILFDQVTEQDVCDCVTFDYEYGGYLAFQYLLENGHRNLAFLSAPLENRSSRRALYCGCQRAVQQWGGGAECTLVVEDARVDDNTYWEYENGRLLADSFLALNPRPTAVLVYNDVTAISVMSQLIAKGIRIPEDVSVIGFDNIVMSEYASPALTTIMQPAFETGEMATRILLDKIEGKSSVNCRVNLCPKLIVRKSVKKIG